MPSRVRLDAHRRRGRGHDCSVSISRVPTSCELQPYQHAAWDPSLERMHANEMPWRAQGDNTEAGLNRYPEPQPQALVERMAAALRRAGATACSSGAAATRRSTCWHARSAAPAWTTSSIYSADVRLLQGRGADPGRRRASRSRSCAGLQPRRATAVIAAGRTREARVPVLAQQSDRQPARSTRRCCASASALSGRRWSCLDEAYIEFSGAREPGPAASRNSRIS